VNKAIFAIVIAACGDDGGKDATVDIDNGSCGDQVRLFGEYVDWDDNQTFCGILGATLVAEGNGAMSMTAPNGRYDLCLPDQALTRVNITQPSANSQCTSPISGYTVPTILSAARNVIQGGGFYSARAWTTERQATFFQAAGVQFDSNKAQVFVHVNGTPHPLSLAAPHAATQAVAMTTWAAGDTGKEVFFPNVDVGSGTTTISVSGASMTAGASIPLVAGTITNIAVIIR